MKHEESKLQRTVVKYLRLELRLCKGLVFAIPNGGKRSKVEARIQVSEGTLHGVADLEILLPRGRAVFVEMKTETGKQSEYQEEFEMNVSKLGFDYLIWRNLDDAIRWVQESKRNGYFE